ncbi:2-hydroxyacid dehydrogenase [Pseudoalteromonas sp. H105]|uniref:2-hydroxyacid dehydrogenase n=1 Tax=Pseudoalteromonas sp. H105 TaxID=1348393 RepID=UPI0007322870|nr:glyoxylate/hydroxypyruvate reductase A [Pseudoalteromonas sp. H105]KTF16300.1 glyoxylate/hydroxypyruvate reductase A [Pseudoalteromonas sp. H105]
MHLLLAISNRDCTKLISALKENLPGVVISQWPECDQPEDIEFVVAWQAPADMWSKLPNLKVVSSFGAGVDSIDLDLLAKDVVVTRIVDQYLANDMAEYVLTHVLAQKLRLREYFNKQQNNLWQPKRAYTHNHVLFLGFGELGQHCAKRLLLNDFTVSAFSQSLKEVEGVTCVNTQEQLEALLPSADFVVCLLPLTVKTEGIINEALLSQLPKHAALINVARGQHIVDDDLIAALNNQVIRAATLDVFSSEPLPSEHPYWSHPAITITPHCAALSSIDSVAEQTAKNAKCLQNGLELKYRVDRTKGY